MFLTLPYRPLTTLAAAAAVIAAALGMFGCASKFERDRAAILGMAGEYEVTFEFEEIEAVRDGYELAEPYKTGATELVKVIADEGEFISLQHLLVVWMDDGEPHVIKHWRQDWTYEGTQMYDFAGENRWNPTTISPADAEGAWVQSVYQVDDSPRYWGIGKWEHERGVSTWSAPTNRPLPRREHTKRDDYQIVGAINTHIVTADGWVHEQLNRKIDIHNEASPVIAIEEGLNTYTKTGEVDFSEAEEFWENSEKYWAEVRAVWADVFAKRQPIKLEERWRGDTMFTHLFDLADLYWGEEDVSEARGEVREIIDQFLSRPVAQR
jgi:hypothetical protein